MIRQSIAAHAGLSLILLCTSTAAVYINKLLVEEGKISASELVERSPVKDRYMDSSSALCREWCPDHVSLWELKCSWPGCGACATCHASKDVQRERNSQAKIRYLQYLREQDQLAVKQAADTTGLLASSACADWCGGHFSPWGSKCKWKKCGACSKCLPNAAAWKSDAENKAVYLEYLFIKAKKSLGGKKDDPPAIQLSKQLAKAGHLINPPAVTALMDGKKQTEASWLSADAAVKKLGKPRLSFISRVRGPVDKRATPTAKVQEKVMEKDKLKAKGKDKAKDKAKVKAKAKEKEKEKEKAKEKAKLKEKDKAKDKTKVKEKEKEKAKEKVKEKAKAKDKVKEKEKEKIKDKNKVKGKAKEKEKAKEKAKEKMKPKEKAKEKSKVKGKK